MPSLSITHKTNSINAKVKDIPKLEVLVGIPQEKSSRPEENEGITNAELLFIHTNGSPLNKVPARPVIEPAIEADKELIGTLMGEALKAFLDGDEVVAQEYLEKSGLEGQGAAQDWFDNPNNGWAPNAPSTKKAKIKKGSTDPKPLIDTGELRKAITYVIRERE
jgi:hypothetical protein